MPVLVLLGAGASFGSEPKGGNKTPPLGDNLFAELCKLGGVASKVPANIKRVFEQGFEVGMAEYYRKHNVKLHAFHRELSLFLSEYFPSPNSYYVSLLKLLRGRNVIFSSLNYDMMLEESALAIGSGYNYGIERVYGSIRILKPHGSINFWPDLPHQMFLNCEFEDNVDDINYPVRPIDRNAAKYRSAVDTSLSPAISMYAKGKRVSVCPEFVSNQQEMFSTACFRASKIIVIGVRVVSEDTHIWGPLLSSAAQLTYFGSEKDEVELRAWAYESGRNNVEFVNGYFDQAIQQIPSLI